jgi:hypothetical protein
MAAMVMREERPRSSVFDLYESGIREDPLNVTILHIPRYVTSISLTSIIRYECFLVCPSIENIASTNFTRGRGLNCWGC